jgi:hypothetical protein
MSASLALLIWFCTPAGKAPKRLVEQALQRLGLEEVQPVPMPFTLDDHS